MPSSISVCTAWRITTSDCSKIFLGVNSFRTCPIYISTLCSVRMIYFLPLKAELISFLDLNYRVIWAVREQECRSNRSLYECWASTCNELPLERQRLWRILTWRYGEIINADLWVTTFSAAKDYFLLEFIKVDLSYIMSISSNKSK